MLKVVIMRNIIITICLAFMNASPALAAHSVQGEWLTHARNAKVRIGPCPTDARQMCGVVSWTRDPAVATSKDVKNRDPALRSRPIMGMPVLTGFQRAGAGRWTNGRVYDVNSGQSYDGIMTVQPDGALMLDVCLLKVACRVQTWRRN